MTSAWLRHIARVGLGLLLWAAPALSAGPRGPALAKDTNATRCTLPDTDLAGDVILDRGCFYRQSLRIRASNTTLDCQGAELRGDAGGYALTVTGEIHDIVVRNCYIRADKGIAVRVRNLQPEEPADVLRARSPQGVILERLHVTASTNVGVYLHQYTVGVTLRDSIVTGNDSAGVYLAPYSKGHHLLNNEISHNGFNAGYFWYMREGVAIDGSSEHLLEENDIVGNAIGGVLLYKNCQEHAADNPSSLPRTEHARANVIRNNRFADTPFGVWLASRQSRDLAMMGCGDPTPYDNPIWISTVFHPTYESYASAWTSSYLPFISVWPDFAEDNEVVGNTFEDISRGGVRVEDDGNEVRDNLFIGDFDYVFVGAPFRARLADHPVLDTVIRGNSYLSASAATFAQRLALIPDEHQDTILDDNGRACTTTSGDVTRHGHEGPEDPECPGQALRCTDGMFLSADCPSADAGILVDAGAGAPSDAGLLGDAAIGGDSSVETSHEPDGGADTDAGSDALGGNDAGPSEPQPSDGGRGTAPPPAAPADAAHAVAAGCTTTRADGSLWATLLAASVLVLRRRKRR